jgi:aminoglycoside phosphotransferase (APT) family kinase protein
MVVLEYVKGEDLRSALEQHSADGLIARAARWLARLHAARPLIALREVTPPLAAEKAADWCKEIAAHLGPSNLEEVSAIQQAMVVFGSRMVAPKAAMVHRDFRPANIVWDGDQLYVLDFDELCIGDPALDVGHFLVALQHLADQKTGDATHYAQAEQLFLQEYQESSQHNLAGRLPFYQAYAWLKLAAKEARRTRDGWRDQVRLLTGHARRELEHVERTRPVEEQA